MPNQEHAPSVRALIETAGTPFTAAWYEPRDAIFRQGDDNDSVMHVESGRVELAVAANSGKEAICGLVDAGSFLGEEALTECEARAYTATALEPTELLVVTKVDMQHLVSTEPEVSARLMAHSLSRTIRLANDLTDQLLYSCEKRLAQVLLLLANYDERHPIPCAMPDVTQEFMARMVGTTRSRVNLFLGKFKKHGLIEEHGGVLRINPDLLLEVPDGGLCEGTGGRRVQ